MDNLTTKQKIIFISMIVIMVITIAWYILKYSDGNDSDVTLDAEYKENIILANEDKKEESEKIVIHITGCVLNEGIVKLKEGARIADAIEAAGGLTSDANIQNVNLAYILQDGQKIYIPSNIDEQIEYISMESGLNIIIDEPDDIENSDKVNINTATQTEFETLSGIGPSTALKIIEYRKTNGKFDNIEELKNVPGIGEAKFNSIKNKITVK